jgi:hypothetical protein
MPRTLIVIALALVVAVWVGTTPAQTAPAAPHATTPSNTRERWAIDLLAALGNAQPTPDTIAFVVEWTIAEDTSDGALSRNNPLNTTICGHHWVGAINGDGACGVGGYATEQDGIDATIETITQANFSSIAAALQANDARGARLALWASPWAESHYGYGASWPTYE